MQPDVTKYRKLTQQFSIDELCQLGRGNFGKVFKGYYKPQNKIVAAKFISKQFAVTSCKRQLAVMEELARFRHPNIMEYYGHVNTEQGTFLFIEFCAGGQLKDILGLDPDTNQYRKVSQLKAVTMLKQLLGAMVYINKQNIVHRDLKPQNILLNENNDIKIADFGLARDIVQNMTFGACTPIYAAPEVFLNEKYDLKCDVWSAGMILYQILTGREYFYDVKAKKQLVRRLKKLQLAEKVVTYPKEIDVEWEKLTNYMLVYDPQKRPTFSDVLLMFQAIQPSLTKRLINKYGFQSQHLNDIHDELRITNNVRPYQDGSNIDQSMEDKVKQQISYTNLNNFRKFLTFESLKTEFLLWTLKQFNKNNYNYIKNVIKFILMYFTISAYISRIKAHRKLVSKQQIQMPDKKISQLDFVPKHLQEFKTLKNNYQIKQKNAQHKYQLILANQIKQKIDSKYLQRQEDRKIIQEVEQQVGSISEDIKNSNQRIFLTQQKYIQKYRKLINHHYVHVSTNSLKKLDDADLKTYFVIRVINNLDQFFNDQFYKQDHYLLSKKQELENMSREQMLELVSKIN